MTGTELVAWAIIGAAASLTGMIWPFFRGATGVLGNLLLGVLGAICGAGIVRAVFHVPRGAPILLAVAALGAFAALLLGHMTWRAWRSTRPRARRP
jgi:uncharacterized membrane protein YeaQ/YmgE (transglycosylase-associated protein family)